MQCHFNTDSNSPLETQACLEIRETVTEGKGGKALLCWEGDGCSRFHRCARCSQSMNVLFCLIHQRSSDDTTSFEDVKNMALGIRGAGEDLRSYIQFCPSCFLKMTGKFPLTGVSEMYHKMLQRRKQSQQQPVITTKEESEKSIAPTPRKRGKKRVKKSKEGNGQTKSSPKRQTRAMNRILEIKKVTLERGLSPVEIISIGKLSTQIQIQ